MAEERSELERIKAHLRVTWSSQDDDIQDIIEDGKAFINAKCGQSDFEDYGLARTLLRAYCRYEWSGTVALFEENYKRQLLSLQIENGKRLMKGEA